jgi:hypothetical protein
MPILRMPAARTAPKRMHDLDLLLFAEREPSNRRVRILTVAVDAGNAQHFARPQLEADVLHAAFAGLRCRRDPLKPEQRRRPPINSILVAARRRAAGPRSGRRERRLRASCG